MPLKKKREQFDRDIEKYSLFGSNLKAMSENFEKSSDLFLLNFVRLSHQLVSFRFSIFDALCCIISRIQ